MAWIDVECDGSRLAVDRVQDVVRRGSDGGVSSALPCPIALSKSVEAMVDKVLWYND
jgi:hypothetical protein